MNENNILDLELDENVNDTMSDNESHELVELLLDKKYHELKERLSLMHSADIAEAFEGIKPIFHSRIFRLLSKEQAAVVFVEFDPDIQEGIINSTSDKELSEMLLELYLDDTVDLIEEMPANVVKRILKTSTKENREAINQLLKYPKDSAGSIMTPEYVRLNKDMTVQAALSHIRKVAIDKETIYTCYVTDKNKTLLGLVTAKQLLLSDLDAVIEDIMEENVISVGTYCDKEEVALCFDKYGFIAMPVVDKENRLVGIITIDDAFEVMKEETTEDFAKMAAITPTETTYLKTSVFDLWKARIPWLLFLMISATFSSMLLGSFEAALPSVLILFVPMLMGTGGNSGGQSSVTIIREISNGDVEFSDLLRVLWKEVRVGAFTGITLGFAAFLKLMLLDNLIMQNSAVNLWVSLAVAISLAVTVLSSKLIGAALPILAKKIRLDPAVMASPFITTIVDALSLIIYFLISKYAFGFSVI
jgi:magnesium transporter